MMGKKLVVLAGILLLPFVFVTSTGALTAADGYYDKAQNYLEGKNGVTPDPQEAKRYFQLAAEAGHVRAQAVVGEWYLFGSNGYQHDQAQALKWLGAAASAGDAWAQYLLGWAYHEEIGGVKRDYAQAHRYYQEAFRNMSIDTSSNLARRDALAGLAKLYEKGLGSPKDLNKAVDFYVRSAKLHNQEAQFRVGQLYLAGEGGLPKDEATALIWLKKSALLGNPDAQDLLRKKYKINVFELTQSERDELYYRFTGSGDGKAAAAPAPVSPPVSPPDLSPAPPPAKKGPAALPPKDLDLSDQGPLAE